MMPATKKEAFDLMLWSRYNYVELTADQVEAVEKVWKEEGILSPFEVVR